jgi:hypothetical protein
LITVRRPHDYSKKTHDSMAIYEIEKSLDEGYLCSKKLELERPRTVDLRGRGELMGGAEIRTNIMAKRNWGGAIGRPFNEE